MKTVTVTVLLCVSLVVLGGLAEAVASRTTEYHALKMSLTADKTQNIILPDGVFATGFVKDQNGNPVKGAFVAAMLQQANVAAVGGYTDATGKFNLAVQSGGTYTFYVTPPASTSFSPTSFSRLLRNKLENFSVTGDTSVGTIVLQNGFILSGKITGPSGPFGIFAGVLWTFPTNGGPIGFQAAQFGKPPGNSAQYAIALAAGSYKGIVIPTLAYLGSFQSAPVTYTTTNFSITSDKTMDVKLRQGYLLSGTVQDAAHKNLNGLIWIYQKGATFEQNVYVAIAPAFNGKYQTYLPKGNFTATYIPVQAATDTSRAAMTTQNLVMPAGNKVLNFAARNGVILTGKVTDAHNHPVKGSGVMLRGSTNNPWGPSQITYAAFTMTTPTGQYRVVVPPGTDDVIAFPQIAPKPKRPEAAAMDLARRMLADPDLNH